jgi:V-type H+-transporting ATPase subunit H
MFLLALAHHRVFDVVWESMLCVQNLIKLTSSPDNQVAAIACFDIGEFVRHYPNGRALAKRLGAREAIMNLIEQDKDPELQRHALLCVSKMLVQNWEVRT